MLLRATSGVSRAACKSKKMRSGFAILPEVNSTELSRSIVTRVASPLSDVRMRRTRGISPEFDEATDFPPECTGALARASSIATVFVEPEFSLALFFAPLSALFCSRASSAKDSSTSRFLGERGKRFRNSS